MNEEGCLHFRYSSIVFAWQLFALLFLIDTLFALTIVIYALFNPPAAFHVPFIITLWLFHTIKFFIVAYTVLHAVLYWFERSTFIVKNQLVVRRGILTKKEQLYDLSQLKSVYKRQSWIGKRLNFGHIHCLFTASGYTEELNLTNLRDVDYYEQRLSSYLGEA